MEFGFDLFVLVVRLWLKGVIIDIEVPVSEVGGE